MSLILCAQGFEEVESFKTESHSSYVFSVFTVTSPGSGSVLVLEDDKSLNIFLVVP